MQVLWLIMIVIVIALIIVVALLFWQLVKVLRKFRKTKERVDEIKLTHAVSLEEIKASIEKLEAQFKSLDGNNIERISAITADIKIIQERLSLFFDENKKNEKKTTGGRQQLPQKSIKAPKNDKIDKLALENRQLEQRLLKMENQIKNTQQKSNDSYSYKAAKTENTSETLARLKKKAAEIEVK